MRRPLALLISPVLPDARGNGLARRAWSWVAELACEYRLLTIVVNPWSEAKQGSSPLPGEVVFLVGAPSDARRAPPDWIPPSPDLAAALRGALTKEVPARVVIFRLYMAGVASLLPDSWRAIAEIDFDDCESATRRSLAVLALRRGHPRLALAFLRGAAAYRPAERMALAAYRTVYLAAAEDALAFRRRRPPAQVVARPNRIAGPPCPLSPPPVDAARVLFVGTLGYLPNEDAVLWLAERIAPRLRLLVPQAQIAVVGAASSSLAGRMRQAGFDYLGPLDDLAEAYAGASLAVAPLRGGGGTKIKVLEAWLHGRPVVATSHACRGLPVMDGTHLLRADTANQIAAACARLLRDPALAGRLALAGQELLRRHFLLPPRADQGAAARENCSDAR
jgi:glycosyltransferase involved in cell wall biosynthesis